MGAYLDATNRSHVAKYANEFKHNLQADKGAEYDQVINVVSSREYELIRPIEHWY
jgi:aconitate hydratase